MPEYKDGRYGIHLFHFFAFAWRESALSERHFQPFLLFTHSFITIYIWSFYSRLEYQAQSPDESALVSAARNFGFVFKYRTPNSITIEAQGRIEVSAKYNLLVVAIFFIFYH